MKTENAHPYLDKLHMFYRDGMDLFLGPYATKTVALWNPWPTLDKMCYRDWRLQGALEEIN